VGVGLALGRPQKRKVGAAGEAGICVVRANVKGHEHKNRSCRRCWKNARCGGGGQAWLSFMPQGLLLPAAAACCPLLLPVCTQLLPAASAPPTHPPPNSPPPPPVRCCCLCDPPGC
jgi:hypothetical protein